MSKVVDERVVEMRFDNRQFEQNVSTSVSTLDKLKRSLNLSGAAKGLSDVGDAAKRVDMNGLGSSIEGVRAKFSALQVMGVTALANITNSAVNAGKRIVNALTLEPVMSGFQEYETQINAVQTILANTKSKGSTLDDVNKALDELNLYADKTIYNFTEMTRNIGTFTAAGIDLDTSVSAIQGIANLAAVSGSTSQQASTAMYQLSQALAAGTVKLMDWNSVVNAGMGGEIFQNALKETSKELNTGAEAAIKAKGSFRESLQTGWLTSEVLTETLKKFTTSGANEYVAEYTGLSKEAVQAALDDAKAKYGEADAIKYASKALAEKSGKNEEEIKSVLEMANTAEDAATKVKTFTQLWDTLKEAAQSGWTQSWEIIIGDFEEAKELLTQISDTVGAMIQASADARNKVLQDWKDLGGRDDLLEGFKNAFKGIMSVVKPIKEAFSEVFRAISGADVVNITKRFRDFTEGLILSEESAEKVKRAFKGLFSIFDIGRKIVLSVGNAIAKLLGSDGVSSLGEIVLDAAASLGDFFTSINTSFDTDGLSGVLSKIVSGISNVLVGATDHMRGFGDVLSAIGGIVAKVAGKIWDSLKTVFGWISENISAGDIFAGLAGGGIFMAAKKLSGFLDSIVDAIKGIFGGDKGDSIKSKFSDVLDSAHDALSSFASGIKISSLISIAIAIGILSASMKTISDLNVGQITKSLLAIGAMLGMLSITMGSITKTLTGLGSKGLIKAGVSLMLVAAAVGILASAMKKMADLSLAELARGLLGVGAGLTILSAGLRAISKAKVSLSTSIAIIALAGSCSILAEALKKFGGLSMGEIAKGLIGMGGALAALVGTMSILNKFAGGKSLTGSVAMLIAVQSLSKLADGLKKFGQMSWSVIGHGLTAMGLALGELTVVLSLLGKFGGFSSILGAGAILIVVQGLDDLASALERIGSMSWEVIGHGLTGMGVALAEIGTVTGLLGKLAGFSGLLGAGSILIVIQGLGDLASALERFGWMSWDEIARGLVGMGGALLEVGAIAGALGALTGPLGLLGAGALLLAIQGLADLADAFKTFGEMSWDEIGRGLAGMGGALGEVAIITGALGSLAGLPALLGGGAILLAIQGLGDLADALKKFGEMSWDEIGRGLSAMGGALSELAVGGFMNTLSIIGSISIATVAEPLGALADSVKKWVDVKIPDGLGLQLGDLAAGVATWTFSGIGAGALWASAESVGTLADSVKKWAGVTVPDGLDIQLANLAAGVATWTFSGIGAISLWAAAESVGTLADSVKKWSNVTIPDGLEDGLKSIAYGVEAFTFAFVGGWSIGAIVTPLANLADSVNKWNGVKIPTSLETDLKALASGVQAFTFAFIGGWSLSAIVGPLGDLATSVKKWNGVKIPDTLGDDLDALAAGVDAFKWSFVGGWSLGTITGPLGDLATSVKKWNGVKISSDLGDQLKSLASGVKSFSGITDISVAAKAMKTIASATVNLSGINYPNIASGLTTLSDVIKKFASINSVKDSLATFGSDLIKGVVTPIKNATPQFASMGSNIADSLVKGMRSKLAVITTTITSMMTSTIQIVNSKRASFNLAGSNLTAGLASGVKTKASTISTTFTSAIQSAVSSIKLQRSNFYNAGGYLAEGFANGIGASAFKAEAKAVAMATAALEAAKEAMGINSPSKEFYKVGEFCGLGFVNAIGDYGDKVHKASENMAEYAKTGLSNAIGKIRDGMNGDMDVQPTIRPVVDLSNVKTGAAAITDMLSEDRSLGVVTGVNAVSSMMKRRGQNGNNDGVITAIDKLHKDLNSLSRPSYTIDGITYDDGSEVSEAIKTLVRAAKIERRV